MTAETGKTASRLLNRLAFDIANAETGSADIGTVASNDRIPIYDVSGEIVGYTTPISLGTAPPATRFVSATAATTALTLSLTTHGEKVVLINSNTTVANTYTLPAASGSGVKYMLVNNVAQTQGSIVITVNGTDILKGKAIALDTTASADAQVFLTTAISDTVTFNRTTTGGLGFDTVEVWDVAANTWLVLVEFVGSGSLATPFSGS